MGYVSFEELVDLVVTFTFPAGGSSENFDCTLTYFDEDEDTITIASTTELVDAIEQFVDKKVLRISTDVKRKTSPAEPAPRTPQQGKSRFISLSCFQICLVRSFIVEFIQVVFG